MESVVIEAILTALATIVVGFLSWLSPKIANFFKEKVTKEQIESKQYLIDAAVKTVEKVWQNEDGAVKYDKAKDKAVQALNENNIPVSDTELDNFIEASVLALTSGFKDEAPKTEVNVTTKEALPTGDVAVTGEASIDEDTPKEPEPELAPEEYPEA